ERLLQVDHDIVRRELELAAEDAELAPGAAHKHGPAPAAQREWNDAAYAAIERDQRSELLLGNPVDLDTGTMTLEVVHDRQRMHDIHQRPRAYDQRLAIHVVSAARSPAESVGGVRGGAFRPGQQR